MLLKKIYLVSIMIGYLLFILYGTFKNPYEIPFIKTKMFEKHNCQYIADKHLGYRPAPNFSGYSDLAAYTDIYYDHLGARVNSPSDKTPSNVQLITLGCSQTFGQGVTNEETFTQKISKITGMKVANLGVSSYGGVESLLRLQENLNLQPKYVVYVFWEDHFNRNLLLCNQTFPVCLERPVLKPQGKGEFDIIYPNFTNAAFTINQRWFTELANFYNKQTYSILKASFWPVIKPIVFIHNMVNKMNGYSNQIKESEKIPAAKYIIRKMNDTAATIGSQLIVVFMPYYSSEKIFTMPVELFDFLTNQKIAFINLEHTFRKMNEEGIPISIPKDGHINKETHDRIAKDIIAKIEELEKKDLRNEKN